jgi:hypothetical protein
MTDIEAIKAKLLAKRDWTLPINPDGPEAVAVLDALVADNERLRGVIVSINVAIDKARDTVPDDDEGVAANIFCHFLNRAQGDARAALKDAARD